MPKSEISLVLAIPKEVPKIFFPLNLNFVWQKSTKMTIARSLFLGSMHKIKCLYTFHIVWPKLIGATVSEIRRIRHFYTKSAETSHHHCSDEQGSSYCPFSGTQNWDFKKKKNMLGTSLEKSKTTYEAKKSNLVKLWSEEWDSELPGLGWSHCISQEPKLKKHKVLCFLKLQKLK